MYIEHLAMYVDDLEGAKHFFETYFKAKAGDLYHNKVTNFKSYFLSFNQGPRLEIMTRPEVTGDNLNKFRKGLAHFAVSVGSKDEVDRLSQRLDEDGYVLDSGPRITGDGYYESVIIGFEGNLIEITI